MSPEQVSGEKLDLRSDIYSFGVTCYHLLNGEPPFRGETALSVAVQHLKNEPEPLSQLRPDLPPLLCQIVHKMMAKGLEQRYQSAQEVLKDFKRLAGGKLAAAASLSPTQPSGRWIRALDASWKSQLVALLFAAFVVAGLAAGLGWAMRLRDPFSPPRTTDVSRFRLENIASNGEAGSRGMSTRLTNDEIFLTASQ